MVPFDCFLSPTPVSDNYKYDLFFYEDKKKFSMEIIGKSFDLSATN